MDKTWQILDDDMQRRLDALRELSESRLDSFERRARRDAVAWWLVVAAAFGLIVFLACLG